MLIIEQVDVSDPQLQSGALQAFVTYLVRTVASEEDETGKPATHKVEFAVRRRYRDFVLLQNCLRAKNPGCILPPLPPPTLHLIPSSELIESRLVCLGRFLHNLAANTRLQRDPLFWLFLEIPDFASAINSAPPPLAKAPPLARERVDPAILEQRSAALGGRLEYLVGIGKKLKGLRSAAHALLLAKSQIAAALRNLARALSGGLDATMVSSGRHTKVVQLVDALDQISISIPDPPTGPNSFLAIIDDYLWSLAEVKKTFALRHCLEMDLYRLRTRQIDIQASLLRSNYDRDRDFDHNYRLMEHYHEVSEETGRMEQAYAQVCLAMQEDLDRYDLRRMQELEACVKDLFAKLFETQSMVRRRIGAGL